MNKRSQAKLEKNSFFNTERERECALTFAMEVHILAKAFISLALVGVLGLFLRLHNALVAEPRRLRSKLRKHGISGPPPSFLLGNIGEIKKARTANAKVVPTCGPPTTHDCATVLLPFFEKWRKLYGMYFQYIYL